FAEIIDYDEKRIDNGMDRLKRIKKIQEKHNKSKLFFEELYLLPTITENGFIKEEIDFKTSKRNEILKQYLGMEGNVYATLDLNTISDFEKEMPLLYMHFRWMVYNLSSYNEGENKSIQADILNTTQTKHNVLLKK